MFKNWPVYLLILLLSTGCLARRSVPTRFYILEYPTDITVDIQGGPVEQSLLIAPVEIAPAYASNQIAVRESSHEIRYFAFNHWAVRPEQSFTSLLTDFMRRNNIFYSVQTVGASEPDLVLETSIYHLELIDEGNDFSARLHIEYRLRSGFPGKVLLDHRADRKHPLDENDLNMFAGMISRIFIEELGVFTNFLLANVDFSSVADHPK